MVAVAAAVVACALVAHSLALSQESLSLSLSLILYDAVHDAVAAVGHWALLFSSVRLAPSRYHHTTNSIVDRQPRPSVTITRTSEAVSLPPQRTSHCSLFAVRASSRQHRVLDCVFVLVPVLELCCSRSFWTQ